MVLNPLKLDHSPTKTSRSLTYTYNMRICGSVLWALSCMTADGYGVCLVFSQIVYTVLSMFFTKQCCIYVHRLTVHDDCENMTVVMRVRTRLEYVLGRLSSLSLYGTQYDVHLLYVAKETPVFILFLHEMYTYEYHRFGIRDVLQQETLVLF